MNTFLLLTGIFSGFFHSIYSAVSKYILNSQIKEPFLLFLYINIFQAITTPALWLFIEPSVPSGLGWSPLLLSGITCVIAYLFLYSALSSGDVSSVMPIMGSKVVFAGILAIFLLQEKHTWAISIAALLVALSVGVLSYSPSTNRENSFPLQPILLMLLCTIAFAFTDILINRSLQFIDSYNFMVYYNLIVGLGSLGVIPYLMKKNVTLSLASKNLWWVLSSSVALVTATLLLVISFEIAEGVVIPNILISTRGIFIVLISAIFSHRGSTLLDSQTRKIYYLRLAASGTILLSIWIALSP